MRQYVLRRLLLMIPTLLGVAVLVFVLIRVIPGDIVEMRFAEGQFFTPELVAKERARLGLDRPLWRQFLDWLWGIVRLDFGLSMWSGNPIAHEIAIRLQLSLQLAVMATVVAVCLAIPLGTLAALRQDTWLDYLFRMFSIAGLATPSFWLGILMFLVLLHLFGWIPPMVFRPFWEAPWQNLSQMIWPALAVGYRYSAVTTRMTRSAMLEVLREDYIRTARAKRLWQNLILSRHALKNAMLPVLTVIALEFAFLMGGLVVTEQVFNPNVLAPYDPLSTDYAAMLAAPSAAHWLGTDAFGRDVLSRIIYGSRTAMLVGFACAFFGATTGAVIGVTSAYFGRRIDLVVQRVMDIFLSFPLIILALAVVSILGTGVLNVILAIAIPMIPRAALVARSSALAIREMPYVDAARAAGYRHRRIILRHMLPNVMAPYLIMLTAFLGQAVLLESSLSFLGLGVAEPIAAWGLMLRGAAVEFAETAPWMAIFPGLAISLSVFAFNLFGDSLRDALDPRLRVS